MQGRPGGEGSKGAMGPLVSRIHYASLIYDNYYSVW